MSNAGYVADQASKQADFLASGVLDGGHDFAKNFVPRAFLGRGNYGRVRSLKMKRKQAVLQDTSMAVKHMALFVEDVHKETGEAEAWENTASGPGVSVRELVCLAVGTQAARSGLGRPTPLLYGAICNDGRGRSHIFMEEARSGLHKADFRCQAFHRPAVAVSVLLQAIVHCQSLFALGIVHNDVRPDNVLLLRPRATDTEWDKTSRNKEEAPVARLAVTTTSGRAPGLVASVPIYNGWQVVLADYGISGSQFWFGQGEQEMLAWEPEACVIDWQSFQDGRQLIKAYARSPFIFCQKDQLCPPLRDMFQVILGIAVVPANSPVRTYCQYLLDYWLSDDKIRRHRFVFRGKRLEAENGDDRDGACPCCGLTPTKWHAQGEAMPPFWDAVGWWRIPNGDNGDNDDEGGASTETTATATATATYSDTDSAASAAPPERGTTEPTERRAFETEWQAFIQYATDERLLADTFGDDFDLWQGTAAPRKEHHDSQAPGCCYPVSPRCASCPFLGMATGTSDAESSSSSNASAESSLDSSSSSSIGSRTPESSKGATTLLDTIVAVVDAESTAALVDGVVDLLSSCARGGQRSAAQGGGLNWASWVGQGKFMPLEVWEEAYGPWPPTCSLCGTPGSICDAFVNPAVSWTAAAKTGELVCFSCDKNKDASVTRSSLENLEGTSTDS